MVYVFLQYSTFILSCSCSFSPALRRSCGRCNVLEWIFQLVVLAHVVLSPPLGCDVLHHHLAHVGLHESANEPGIPELGGDSQIFAAAHERIRLAALGRGGDAVGVEVLLFATGEGDEAKVNGSAGEWNCRCPKNILTVRRKQDRTLLSPACPSQLFLLEAQGPSHQVRTPCSICACT